MKEKIINVGLYGGEGLFGGKESPLEASVIRCDKYEECSYYKNNQCLKVRAFLSGNCKYGSISNIRGYTSRAKKYYDFKSQWQKHEAYSKLKYPPQKLGLIENEVVFPYSFIRVKKNDNGRFEIDVPFGSAISFIDYQDFTVELIERICNFRPQAMMGGTIKDYQSKIVPTFLAHLKEVFPEKYNELKDKKPELVKEVNYIGRTALLKTIKPSIVCYQSDRYPQFNEKWEWDGELLIYKNGYVSSFNITKDYEVAEIRIKPSDKSTIKITSNEQVTNETVFID